MAITRNVLKNIEKNPDYPRFFYNFKYIVKKDKFLF